MFDRPDRERAKPAVRRFGAGGLIAGGLPSNVPPAVRLISRAGNHAVATYLQRQSHSAGAPSHPRTGHTQTALAADQAAVDRILTIGAHSPQSIGLVAHGRRAGVSGRSILQAMTVQGGSPAQQVIAGIAFCVLRGAGSPAADFVETGRISVRIGDAAVLAGGIAAVYVSRPTSLHGVTLEADTMYLKANLSAEEVPDQATVVHEAEHAVQDSRPDDALTHSEAEVRAYVAQASYTWAELDSIAGSERTTAIAHIGAQLSSELLIALSIGAAATPARRATYAAILSASPFPVPNPTRLEHLMNSPEDAKLDQLARLIAADYRTATGVDTSDAADFDGIRSVRHR